MKLRCGVDHCEWIWFNGEWAWLNCNSFTCPSCALLIVNPLKPLVSITALSCLSPLCDFTMHRITNSFLLVGRFPRVRARAYNIVEQIRQELLRREGGGTPGFPFTKYYTNTYVIRLIYSNFSFVYVVSEATRSSLRAKFSWGAWPINNMICSICCPCHLVKA